jgi:hypothetical protein
MFTEGAGKLGDPVGNFMRRVNGGQAHNTLLHVDDHQGGYGIKFR